MITDRVRQRVQERAQSATSERQIGNIIFNALSDSGIAWKHVDRDGMKQLVVDAVRAFRLAQRGVHSRTISHQSVLRVAG
jgi:hypothetical protein